MPTLGEAAQLLGIGRVTLEKWMKRLGIVPTRHEWDYRFYAITDEEVERIRDVRASLPGTTTPLWSPSYTYRPSITPTPLVSPRAPLPRAEAGEAPEIPDAPERAPVRGGPRLLTSHAARNSMPAFVFGARHFNVASDLPPGSLKISDFAARHHRAVAAVDAQTDMGKIPLSRVMGGRKYIYFTPEDQAITLAVWRASEWEYHQCGCEACRTEGDTPALLRALSVLDVLEPGKLPKELLPPTERNRDASATRPIDPIETPSPDDERGQED